MNLFPKKTVSKRSKPLTNLSMISMISLMSLRNLENYSAVNLCTGPTFITAVPVCCPGRVTSWGHWHGEVTSWSLHVVSWGRIGGYRAEPMSHIYMEHWPNTRKSICQSGTIRQNQAININQHQHTNQACFGTFLADLVRCWKALPAVHVEHHRFPHAERQVLHKSKGRGMVWPWTIPNPFNIGTILTGGMSIFADVQPLVVENVTSSLFLVDFGLAGLATIVNSRWFKQQG